MFYCKINCMENIKKYLPLAIGLIIVVIIVVLAPWSQIAKLLSHISLTTLLTLIGLSMIYYGTKVIRFWLMLRQLGFKKPLKRVGVAYMSVQVMSQLPAGELYRTVALERFTGIEAAKSSPTVTMQGLVEAVALIAFALIGAFILGRQRVIVAMIALLLIIVLVSLRKGWLLGKENLLNKLPFVQVSRAKFNRFVKAHQVFLKPTNFAALVGLSIIAISAAILILFLAARAVGTPLSLAKTTVIYCLPVVLSGLTFLPAGLGASESSSIGLLKLVDVPIPSAIAITLIIRIFTLGAGLFYGLIFMIIAHLWGPKMAAKRED